MATLRAEDSVASSADSFTAFVGLEGRHLEEALVARLGADAAPDALSAALLYAWQHWDRVAAMRNPAGYVYRVGVSRGRRRGIRGASYPAPDAVGLPDIDPRLPKALGSLTVKQRTAVFLVHGCGWSQAEAATFLGVSSSSLRNHLARGADKLRRLLGDSREA
jgi:DNA-directed RNA polymerase specialized sigma24 family protein